MKILHIKHQPFPDFLLVIHVTIDYTRSACITCTQALFVLILQMFQCTQIERFGWGRMMNRNIFWLQSMDGLDTQSPPYTRHDYQSQICLISYGCYRTPLDVTDADIHYNILSFHHHFKVWNTCLIFLSLHSHYMNGLLFSTMSQLSGTSCSYKIDNNEQMNMNDQCMQEAWPPPQKKGG